MWRPDFHKDREELSAAFRLAAKQGWQSGICNHFSLAVGDEHFLINAQGYHWSEITASSLLLLDTEGNLIEGEGTVERTAFHIHSNIHRFAPAAKCVLHAHPRFSTSIACIEGGRLEYCHQDSLRFFDRIAYDDDFEGAAVGEDEGRRIATQLGNRQVMLMAHHGVTVTGTTVARAYNDLYYLEKACEYQVTARAIGKLRVIDEETCRNLAPAFMEDEKQIDLHFAASKRILDRQEPEYRK